MDDHFDVFEVLVKRGTNINAITNQSRTALMMGISFCFYELLTVCSHKYLLFKPV